MNTNRLLAALILSILTLVTTLPRELAAQSWIIPKNFGLTDKVISEYQEKRLRWIAGKRAWNQFYTVNPAGNAKKFEQEQNLPSRTLNSALKSGPLYSYLYYEKGKIKYNGVAAKGRFARDVDDEMVFPTHSTGKSITSYVLGHAICEGYIQSIDEIVNWPMMSKTLYQGQPLKNLLNMSAGDSHTVNSTSHIVKGNPSVGFRHVGLNRIAEMLEGTKSRGNSMFYNNLLSDILANYIVFRAGENYDALMKKVFQEKVKIAHPVSYEKRPYSYNFDSGGPETTASYSYFLTRLDFLRVAEAMMKDYQSNNCVGQYLRESQAQAKGWYKYGPHNPQDAGFSLHRYAKKYGSQFYFDFDGMDGRNIMATEGKNSQNMLIDLDNSRIVVTNSAANRWNVKVLMLDVIKRGQLPD